MIIDQPDVWALVQNGYFEQACKIADEEYERTKDVFPLRNKVYALFHLGKYEEIIFLTEQLIKLEGGESSGDFLFCGIANWILDKKKEAIVLWQRGAQSKYQDAPGGMDVAVILYFASIKTGDDILKMHSIKKIKKLLKDKRSGNWPGPLGHYILGEMTENSMLSYVSTIPILKERNLCQAHFVIAIKCLERGDIEGYKKSLQDSISFGPSSYLEEMYYFAKGEWQGIANGQ